MQLLQTHDFAEFSSRPLSGPGARNTGLALFPRQIGGRYVALSRADRENNAVTTSDDLLRWDDPVVVQRPQHGWELVQLGNCGPPDRDRARLARAHPRRRRHAHLRHQRPAARNGDPTRVVAGLARPLLRAVGEERSGYVPNVVYSCGAMRHGRSLVLPYGSSDSAARVAVVDLDALLDELRAAGT